MTNSLRHFFTLWCIKKCTVYSRIVMTMCFFENIYYIDTILMYTIVHVVLVCTCTILYLPLFQYQPAAAALFLSLQVKMNDLCCPAAFHAFHGADIRRHQSLQPHETTRNTSEKLWETLEISNSKGPNRSKSFQKQLNEEPSSIFLCLEGAASCRHLSNELSVRTQHSSEIDSNSPKDCWLDWANDNHASILYLALALLVACDKTQSKS